MSGEQDLNTLLSSMQPELQEGEWVFCTVTDEIKMTEQPLLVFREKEGATIIVRKQVAVKYDLPFEGVWSLITLNVHSALEAVGFLAKISEKLAEEEISVNAVSAYYHDHLFVQKNNAEKAMKVLRNLTST